MELEETRFYMICRGGINEETPLFGGFFIW